MKKYSLITVVACVSIVTHAAVLHTYSPNDKDNKEIKKEIKRSSKSKNPVCDLRFSCSMDKPGVTTIVVRKFPKKTLSPQEPLLIFSVNGKKSHARQDNDSTYFVHINSMQRWSSNSPVCYSVNVTCGNKQLTRRFGIHDIAVCRGMITMNDTTIIQKGLTEEALPIATTLTVNDWCTYFRDIKSKGFTVISLSRQHLTEELMTAADITGIIVHVRVSPQIEVPKGKKKGKAEVVVKKLMEEYVEHPSLCLATFMQGAEVENSDYYLPAHLFNPVSDINGSYIPDYSTLIDTTKVCLADFSGIIDQATLQTCLEKTLCTPGVGVLLFSSIQQSYVWKDIMILGKYDRDKWDNSMSMSMDMYLANNSGNDINNAKISWGFIEEQYDTTQTRSSSGCRFLPHTVSYVLRAFSPLMHIHPNDYVTVNVRMENTNYMRSWRHRIQYSPLILRLNDEVQNKHKEWCKRKSMETEEDYNDRVNDVTTGKKIKQFAYDIVTKDAGDLIGDKSINASYDGNTDSLTITVGKEFSFKVKASHQDGDVYADGDELELRNPRYGLTNKDKKVLVYAEVYNRRTEKTIVYRDYKNEEILARIMIRDRFVPAELKTMAEREDSILQQIKESAIQKAKEQNLITKYTKFNVKAYYENDYDDDGDTQNNYCIEFDYNVDARYSETDDYPPSRYHVEDSHAALSMLQIITSAFDTGFARYIIPGKKLNVIIVGSADSSPILRPIAYDGSYGEFHNEKYYLEEESDSVTVTTESGITENRQLAFMRAQGVHDYLMHNLTATREMKVRYFHNIELPEGRGGKFRHIKVKFTFVDVSKNTIL